MVQANYVRSGKRKVTLFLPLIQVEIKGVRIMKLQTESSWIRQHDGKVSLVCSTLNVQSKLFTQKHVITKLASSGLHVGVILTTGYFLSSAQVSLFLELLRLSQKNEV